MKVSTLITFLKHCNLNAEVVVFRGGRNDPVVGVLPRGLGDKNKAMISDHEQLIVVLETNSDIFVKP